MQFRKHCMENLPLNESWEGIDPIFGIRETKRTAPILLLFDKQLKEMKKDIFASIFKLLCAELLKQSNCKLTA